jgi:hypothetical protein
VLGARPWRSVDSAAELRTVGQCLPGDTPDPMAQTPMAGQVTRVG